VAAMIAENVLAVLASLPPGVELVAAAKTRAAAEILEAIEAGVKIIGEIDKRSAAAGKTMDIFVEVNSGREPQKAGVAPEAVEPLIRSIAALPRIRVRGLMTMGPFEGNPEDSRPYFVETRKVWESLKRSGIAGVEMRYLSMGMSNSYRVAIEEGANLVRLGTALFGPRP
jgi:PLP dependent protein